jgi:hypothetical protein
MLNDSKRITGFTIVSASIILAALVVAGTFIPASAIHNEHGHEDKLSVGECKRFTDASDVKEFCQSRESKEFFKETRKEGLPEG